MGKGRKEREEAVQWLKGAREEGKERTALFRATG
jgi:hypothetical protein